MKTYRNFVVLFLLFYCFQLEASNIIKEDSIAVQLFIKSEQKAMEFRNKTMKMRFVDPIELNNVFYNIVMKESPELYTDTRKYKIGLLNILKDRKIKKDGNTNLDVFRILDNLCIDDYVDVIDSVYSFYKQKQVTFDDLDYAIAQDFNMSIQVAKKYKNEKLQQLLSQILQDIKTGNLLVVTTPYGFQEEIENLLSGKSWEDLIEHVTPLLKQKNCD